MPTRITASKTSTEAWVMPAPPPPAAARNPMYARAIPPAMTRAPARMSHRRRPITPSTMRPRPASRAAPAIPEEALSASGHPPSRQRLTVPMIWAPARKHRAHTQRDSHQRDRFVERGQPQHRNHSGGPEELPVEQPEHDRGQPRPDDERPAFSEPGKGAGSSGAHQESENDEQGTVSGVPEHHSEHQHVCDAGERAGVDVGVRHRPVRLDQRRERPPHALSALQQGRGVHAARRRDRHDAGADVRQSAGQVR